MNACACPVQEMCSWLWGNWVPRAIVDWLGDPCFRPSSSGPASHPLGPAQTARAPTRRLVVNLHSATGFRGLTCIAPSPPTQQTCLAPTFSDILIDRPHPLLSAALAFSTRFFLRHILYSAFQLPVKLTTNIQNHTTRNHGRRSRLRATADRRVSPGRMGFQAASRIAHRRPEAGPRASACRF